MVDQGALLSHDSMIEKIDLQSHMRAASLALVVAILFAASLAKAECGNPNRSGLGSARAPAHVQSNGNGQGDGNGQGNRNGSIVGLWHVTYVLTDGTFYFQSFDQFYSDGNEFEGASIAPGAFCQGTWKQIGHRTVQLFHLGWNFDLSGNLVGYFTETQIEKVSGDGNSYEGTFDVKNFDMNGNPDPIFGVEISGTVTAQRINGSFSLGN